MEFSSIWYLSFWSIISQVSLLVALVASHDANLAAPKLNRIIFSPYLVAVTIFFAATISLFSSVFVFFVRPMKEPDLNIGDFSDEIVGFLQYLSFTMVIPMCGFTYLEHLQQCSTILGKLSSVFSLVSLTFLFYLVAVRYYFVAVRYRRSKEVENLLIGLGGPFLVYPSHTFALALFTASLFSVAYFGSCQGLCEAEKFYDVATSFFGGSMLTTVGLLIMCFTIRLSDVSRLLEKYKEKINMVEAPLCLLGYVVSQYCLQEKSVSLMVMLSSSAIYCLAVCAMLRARFDFGILKFLIGAILDCAISLFGLGKFTWIVWAACVVLVLLQSKLNSVELRYPPAQTNTMSNWLNSEIGAREALIQQIARLTDCLYRERQRASIENT